MNLQVFKNNEFGAVRVFKDENGEPWFVAKDVCNILGYSNPRKAIADHVDDEDKGVTICDTLGGKQKVTIINESGLYSLILGSKKPEAKKFKRWVTSEVLPAIRKHGMYATPETIYKMLADPKNMIKILETLAKEQERRKALEKEMIELKPKAFFADVVSNSNDAILVRDFAKLISKDGFSIGEKRLYRWLRENGYLMSDNKPYQKYVDMGIFKVIERSVSNSEGTKIVHTTKITGKGQVYLSQKLNEYFNIKGGQK